MRISDWSSDVCSSDLNNVFYVLVANELMDAGDNRFDELLAQIEGLPDRSFGDVSEIVLHAADVCYFNDISRSPERAVELRRRLVARASKLRYWNRDRSEEHTSELQSLMRISYAVFCLKKKKIPHTHTHYRNN